MNQKEKLINMWQILHEHKATLLEETKDIESISEDIKKLDFHMQQAKDGLRMIELKEELSALIEKMKSNE